MGLPQPGGEQVNLCSGVLADALKHIDQVVVGIDAVQAAGDDQALDDADMFRTEFRPGKHPRLPTHRNRPERTLQVVGVDGDIRIGEEDFEPASSISDVGKCLGQRTAWQEALVFELA